MKIDETRRLPSKFLVVLRGWFRLNSDGHFLGGLEIQSHKHQISKWQAIWFQTNIRMQIHHILSWIDTCGFVVCCHRTWGVYVDGCFTWMIQNLYLGHVCFTNYPFNTGYLQFQIMIYMLLYILVGQMHHCFFWSLAVLEVCMRIYHRLCLHFGSSLLLEGGLLFLHGGFVPRQPSRLEYALKTSFNTRKSWDFFEFSPTKNQG